MAEEAKTTVTKVEVTTEELNELLGVPGADNVMLPEDEGKPTFFSADKVDMSFLTNAKKKVEIAPVTKDEEGNVIAPANKDDVTGIIEEVHPPEEKVKTPTAGRPQVVKDGMVETTKKLIEKGIIVPFDDDKKLEDYTTADFQELFEANFKDREEKAKQETPIEFFDSLPNELQYAAKYAADGGTDFKGLFKALAEVQETRELSLEEAKDQETIVKQYLMITNFGSEEDIQEEIDSWKDRNELDKKAEKFKPKLDRMREEQVAYKLSQQEATRKQQQQASVNYANSVYEVLKSATINGIKLDRKTQDMLYAGLVQPQYPSISGRPTNLFGHLIEKYQFVEPNHSLIAEALWLLADPEGYKSKVKEATQIETTENIVRKLKTEEGKKISSSPVVEKEETTQKRIPRNNSFFKR